MAVRLSGKDKISLISNFTTMLSAGIPIYEVVESLLEEAKSNQKIILETLRDDLMAGNQIHITFAKFPLVFDKVMINLIKASEEAGTLETTLEDLQKNIKKEMEFSDQIRSALIYPSLIMVVFVGVLLIILTVVVPKMSGVFTRMKIDLPLSTRILLAMSDFLMNNYFLVAGGLIVLIGSLVILYRQKKHLLLGLLFSLPIISKLMVQIDATRFSRSLHLLLASGLPITFALELAQEVVQKREMVRAITEARQLTTEGHQFSEGLKNKKNLFAPTMVKLMEVGEKTGKLEKAMQDIAEHMDYEVSKTLKTTTTLIEPLMLMLMGVAVGGLMMAIIAPIYGLISQVGGS